MDSKMQTIEVDQRTAEVLQAHAAARGISVPQLLADFAADAEALTADLFAHRVGGEGPWSQQVLAEDAVRLAEFERTREGVTWDEVETWMQSWRTSNELPPPKPRRL
jgi:hypothetical protein